MKVFYPKIQLAAAGVFLLMAGCSSITNSHLQKEPMMKAYLSGRNAEVAQRIGDKLRSSAGTGDELMWRLEAGAFR